MPFLSMIIYAKNEYCKKISLTEIQKPRQILNVGAFVSMIIAMHGNQFLKYKHPDLSF